MSPEANVASPVGLRMNASLPSYKTSLSIVIVSWNTRDLLARCLGSLPGRPSAHGESQTLVTATGLSSEVFVVDNASTDGSAQTVREKFPWVRLIANRENVGFARANNRAFRETTGRYVLLLNPDTEVRPGALETLVRFMDEHPQVGASGARLLNPSGVLQLSNGQPAPTLSRELWRLFHLDPLWLYATYPLAAWDLHTPREVEVVEGACLLVRRDALDQVGVLDEDYFIYSEEEDLCHRLRQHGWKVYWVPEAVVVHYGGQSTRQAATAMFLRLYQGKVLYFRKRQGRLAAQLYKLILLAASLARLAVVPFVWLGHSSRRGQHLGAAGHYLRLVRALPGM